MTHILDDAFCAGCGRTTAAHGDSFPCGGYDVLVEHPDHGNLVPGHWDDGAGGWAVTEPDEPTDAQLERLNNADSGPSSSAYRAAMRDAGRGGLLR